MNTEKNLAPYQKFSQKKKLEGKSSQEVSELWEERKKHPIFSKLDIDQLIEAFLEWYGDSLHNKNETAYDKEITEKHLANLSKEKFIDFFIKFAKEGGKIQSGS